MWLDVAVRLKGTVEDTGSGSNPVILDWADDLGIHLLDGDDTPWCGLFVAHRPAVSLPEEPLPSGPLGARNWMRLGELAEPAPGAVTVFWRGSPGGALGHVAFHESEDDDSFHLLGGHQFNQANAVRIAKDRLLGARWPVTAGVEPSGFLEGSLGGAASQNEQ